MVHEQPACRSYAQHILSNGTEAFPHNGSAGAVTGNDVRVSPTVSYNPSTQETFLVWTEEDSLQSVQGISAQKFNSCGRAAVDRLREDHRSAGRRCADQSR